MAAMETAEQRFGERVKWERERRKWSQADLARRVTDAGVAMHPTTITKIEARDSLRPRSIRLDEADALARVFEKSIDQLLGTSHAIDRHALNEELAASAAIVLRRLKGDLSSLRRMSLKVSKELKSSPEFKAANRGANEKVRITNEDFIALPIDVKRMGVALARLIDLRSSGDVLIKELETLASLTELSDADLLLEAWRTKNDDSEA
ncbi:helix-turn-helix domain-containing protein [Rhodococcus sp. EPR-134]|uniref:helix-turn-helix domain-containing protein n=1 Tax=Rhodococcus sp. EPR-134 TaxID=1813675 RepID=UPI0007BBC92B|nr:helix-turn-helix domain-containing protein [Rhodococcus sp. EPR-134]KZF15881.1 hypothetical protein A2J01_30590 [Rhodococcus sp. EPR-134]